MIGTTVSHYRILEKLGAGGMGEVYLAQDTELERRVALKFLPPHFGVDPNVRARFKREAQALAALNHPNIVTVFQVAEHGGQPFIAMEYVQGQSLKEAVVAGDLDLERILDLAIQTTDGLAAAHKAEIVHRDVKSDNIILSSDGRVKIMDFGLATWRGVTRVTQEGSTVGTLAYMSPEQAQGKEVDARSDLFSLGVILYELTTKRLPFQAEHEAALAYAVVHDEPAPLARFSAHAPDEWQRVVSKCMAKNAEERYASAPDLLADLKALRRSLAGSPATTKSADTKPTIAVLPLANMSADPENEYFADGLTEELLNVLARNPELKVTARTSSFAFKGKNIDLREVGQKLGVATILEGSVRKAGNRARITAQLVNVADGFHLWSDTYDRVLDDIFAVQDDIARSVAGALKVTLLGTPKTQRAQNPEAYSLYFQGRHFTLRNSKLDLERAVRLYKQAIELDPDDARFWAGLAWAYHLQVGYGTAHLEGGHSTIKETATHALSLDGDCAEALRILATVLQHYEFNWSGALGYLERSVALEPSNVVAMSTLGFHYGCMNRMDEAVAVLDRGAELDPLNPNIYFNLGRIQFWAGRLDSAERAFLKTLELSPAYTSCHAQLATVHLCQGRLDEALTIALKEAEGGYREFALALVYHARGEKEQADAELTALDARGDQWAVQLAIIDSFRGDHDSTLHWLERALETHDTGLCTVASHPLFSALHDDPRWVVFLAKIGLAR